jgi:hypothetical protein
MSKVAKTIEKYAVSGRVVVLVEFEVRESPFLG